MNSELEKMAPKMAAATVMIKMCHFHFSTSWTSERLLKLLSMICFVVVGVVDVLLGAVIVSFFSKMVLFFLGGRFLVGLAAKKAIGTVVEHEAENE